MLEEKNPNEVKEIIDNDSDIVIFTFGLDSNELVQKNLGEYSRCFMFENKKNFPIKSGIIINKLSGSNFVKNFVTQAYTTGIIKC